MSHSALIENNSEDDDSYHDLPFDFRIQDDDLEQSEAASDSNLYEESSYDDGFHWGNDQSDEQPKCESEMTSSSQLNRDAVNVLDDTSSINISNDDDAQQQYQILYSRTQYEQCIKLFTVLDTECKSSLSAECVKEFIWKYCPVVRKRDDALTLTVADEEEQEGSKASPTFNEVWNVVMTSDVNYHVQNVSSLPTLRLGLEGWMLFTRLISLVTYLESQRRFASRHLQQMMRHKYADRGNNSGILSQKVNPNEVVVVIDNPPAGPPLPVSIRVLMEAERELGKEDKSRILVKDWMYASLSMIELDLDRTTKISDDGRYWNQDRKVEIEPFSTSLDEDGDFILRHTSKSNSDDTVTVVRRSYADFCWLNEILIMQKRPGHGNLCGRILPPLPPRHNSSRSGAVQYNPPLPKDVSERAVAVAKSGVGMISSVAKSLWGNYIAPATAAIGVSPLASPQNTVREREHHYHNPLSGLSDQEGVSPPQLARRMNRYLNYMLENQALSTSFPLNAVLMASQSGLKCSKQILNEHAKQKKRRRTNHPSCSTQGGKSSAYAILSTLLAKNYPGDDDTPWLRIAARTAMALQFHGILETTGHESTSARIQHASLPKFGISSNSWDEGETGNISANEVNQQESATGDFESEVICIKSELNGEDDAEGYSLLPSPGPSEEHHVLNATDNIRFVSKGSTHSPPPTRCVYGVATASGSPRTNDLVLGSVKVDSDIDKLKSIIKSMDNILKRLHKSSMIIESAQTTRNALRLDLLKDIDSFGDSRGGVISQRSLVDGVAALWRSNTVTKSSNHNVSDDLGWQAALSSSAVAATCEVQEAVASSRTASRAKAAAFSAAEKTRKVYESLDSASSRDEINTAQSEASAAQSHAIHATVVEYEANIAKKRAAVSLAQDVKSWNAYRKQELRKSCLEYARSQREACQQAIDAWECLLEGVIDSSANLFAPGELEVIPQHRTETAGTMDMTTEQSNISHSTGSYKVGGALIQQEDAMIDVADLTVSAFESDDSADNVYLLKPPNISNLDDDHFALQKDIVSAVDSINQCEDEAMDTCAFKADHVRTRSDLDRKNEEFCKSDFSSGENMSTSMQSLIDGLISWGGEEEPLHDVECEDESTGRGMETNDLFE
eukprot:scaffold8710_cov53-Cyclotella_meneghiniana.AAC.3